MKVLKQILFALMYYSLFYNYACNYRNNTSASDGCNYYKSKDVNKDSLKKNTFPNYVFNIDSFNYYYLLDTAGFKPVYKGLNNKNLLDTASYYFYQIGNNEMGCSCLLSAIKRNDADAFGFLGGIIVNEGKCSKNLYKGFLYLMKSINDKSEQGLMNLANCFSSKHQFEKTLKLFSYGDSLGFDIATFELAYIYYFGQASSFSDSKEYFGKYINKEKGLKMFVKSAEKGNYHAQFELAMIYKGSNKNLAFKYLIQAYNQVVNINGDFYPNASHLLEFLEADFKDMWEKYKKENNIK